MKYSVEKYVEIRCPNTSCLYEWKYRGRFRFYATCPSCRRNVKISENKIGTLQPSTLAGSDAAVAPNSPRVDV